jgi:hypothetical protein
MFVGLCCILCHFQCVNLLFPHRLHWTGSHHQTRGTLEHERQVILSQCCLTTLILVIPQQLLYRNFLWSHVNWSLLLVFSITDYARDFSFFFFFFNWMSWWSLRAKKYSENCSKLFTVKTVVFRYV